MISERDRLPPRHDDGDAMPVDDDPHRFASISERTLAYYDERAEAFRERTRDHDVSQNLDALLAAIAGAPPFVILDLGCGPGRDLAALTGRGHVAIGLDGSARFVTMARACSGCEVWQQDLLALDLPPGRFDGVFANASLFHVPRSTLPRVLGELRDTLRPGGVLFASNPRGDDDEGWNRGRYGYYAAPATWKRIVAAAGFTLLDEYFRPAGLPRDQQPWFATVWRRTR